MSTSAVRTPTGLVLIVQFREKREMDNSANLPFLFFFQSGAVQLNVSLYIKVYPVWGGQLNISLYIMFVSSVGLSSSMYHCI